jgi:hypothetical protein
MNGCFPRVLLSMFARWGDFRINAYSTSVDTFKCRLTARPDYTEPIPDYVFLLAPEG